MHFPKKIARTFVFPSMMGLKMDHLLRKFGDHNLLNIMYHGVVEKDSNFFSPRHIVKEQFEQHLKYFRKNFDIISSTEAFQRMQEGKLPKKKTLSISFDDGYQNNLHVALPLLEKYNIKTTFFIASCCIQETPIYYLWPDLITVFTVSYPNEKIEISSNVYLQAGSSLHQVFEYIKKLDCEKRDQLLSGLVQKYDLEKKLNSLPAEIWKLMNKQELQELSRSSIAEIGSHGNLHYNLGNINPENAKKDMEKSKQLLESAINKEVNILAFPDGSYNDVVKDTAEKIGFPYQMAVDYRLPSDETDKRIMRRHGISSTTTFESNMLLLNMSFKSKGIGLISHV